MNDVKAGPVKSIAVGSVAGGWGNAPIPTLNISVSPGYNVLRVDVTNQGTSPNPAGLLAALYAGKTLLFHTDSDCK